MAVKAQTRAYGQAFAEVLKAAQSSDSHPGRAVVGALRGGPHGYAWPTDEDLAERLGSSRCYGPGGINQDRPSPLLGAVDARLQREAHKGEPVQIQYDQLQVEHVIPRKWKTFWPVEASDPHEQIVLEQRRERHVHRIGNLTLASDRLNPSMGNHPWEWKRAQLHEHSNLRLNVLLRAEEAWNEGKIEERGEWLADRSRRCGRGRMIRIEVRSQKMAQNRRRMLAVRTCHRECPGDSAPSGPWNQHQAQPLESHLRGTLLLQSRHYLPRPAACPPCVEASAALPRQGPVDVSSLDRLYGLGDGGIGRIPQPCG